MNIILDELPETVMVNGSSYFIDTDFRTFIIFEKIILDPNLEAKEKVGRMLELCYTEGIPEDIQSACDAIFDMYRCGAPQKGEHAQQKNGNVTIRQKRIFDYEIDAPYIYGAFLAQYGIDLNEIEYLHWWKFQALFKSLNSSNKIVEIMSYRMQDLGEIENDKERNRIARLQRIYALPQNFTQEEKIAMAGAVFGGMA